MDAAKFKCEAVAARWALVLRDRFEPSVNKPYTRPPLEALAEGRLDPGCRMASRLLMRATYLALRARQWSLAMRLSRASVWLAPSRPDGWLALSEACLASGPTGTVYDPVRGTEVGRIGDVEGALFAADRATISNPGDARVWLQRARVLARIGDVEMSRQSAERAAEVEPSSGEIHYLLGRLAAQDAAQRGSFTSTDFEIHRHHLRTALRHSPRHRHAAYHALRVAFRAGDWATALATAAHGEPVPRVVTSVVSADAQASSAAIDSLVAWGSGVDPAIVPADVWLCIYWRLVALNFLEEAFWGKDRYAEALLAGAQPRTLSTTIERIKALASLGQYHLARELASPTSPLAADRRSATALARMRSDLDLLTGDAAAHADWSFPPLGDPTSEECFAELVHDRHVAVVGPRRTDRDVDRINEHDVVLVTKHLGQASNSIRTDISYYADAAVQLSAEQITESLNGGGLRLAVLRPTSRQHLPGALVHHPGVRIAPAEFSVGLEATPYAIGRIVYDVLRYRPASVTVYHADLFTDAVQYDVGYRGGSGTEPLEVVPGYGHDLRLDHRLMHSLWTNRHLTVSETLAHLLALPEPDYLGRVAHARQLVDRSADA